MRACESIASLAEISTAFMHLPIPTSSASLMFVDSTPFDSQPRIQALHSYPRSILFPWIAIFSYSIISSSFNSLSSAILSNWCRVMPRRSQRGCSEIWTSFSNTSLIGLLGRAALYVIFTANNRFAGSEYQSLNSSSVNTLCGLAYSIKASTVAKSFLVFVSSTTQIEVTTERYRARPGISVVR